MSERLEEFGDGVQTVLVTFTESSRVIDYAQAQNLSFPVLIDSDRSGYTAYGLGRGSVGRVYGWRSARRYLQIFRARGFRRLDRATEDTLQLGGDFVIAPDGSLRYGFWGDGPDDRPSVDQLIGAIR